MQLFARKSTRYLSVLATSQLFLSILKVAKHASTYFHNESPMKANVTEYIGNGAFCYMNCVIQHPDNLLRENSPSAMLDLRCLGRNGAHKRKGKKKKCNLKTFPHNQG